MDRGIVGGDSRRGEFLQNTLNNPGKPHYADVGDLGSYSYDDPATLNHTSPDRTTSKHDHSSQKRNLRSDVRHEHSDLEETITFDYRSPERARHRANREYYNVLEMASNRLGGHQMHQMLEIDYSSGDEGEICCVVNYSCSFQCMHNIIVRSYPSLSRSFSISSYKKEENEEE
jgi:hypothetical protein